MFSEDFRQLIELSCAPVLILDRAGTVLALNRPMLRQLRAEPSATGRNLCEIVDVAPDSLEAALRACSRSRAPIPLSLRGGKSKSIHMPFRGALLRPASERGAAVVVLRAIQTDSSTAQLSSLTQRIQALNAELRKRRKMEVCLLETTHRAEAASRAKTEFLANMSHEIRTPMTAILGYADLLLEDGDLSRIPHDRLEAIDAIKRNGQHLLQVINDILDISKIEAGALGIERIAFSVTEMLDELTTLMSAQAQRKGIELYARSTTPIPTEIRSDPTRIRQILFNLLANAIKFTESGAVGCVVALDGSNLQFRVEDTGIGIDPEALERLFEPFEQADMSTTRRFGGTGLGLAICSHLTRLLGGSIQVESVLGQRTCFSLSLPVGELRDVPLTDYTRRSIAVGHEPRTRRSQRLEGRVLLAEDGADNRRLLGTIVQKAGLELEMALNGREAVERTREAVRRSQPFDVILMDMQMPVLDGYDATREIRALGIGVPIIALTAHALSEDRERCLNAGCDHFATKPIRPAHLLSLLERFLTGEG